MLFRLGKLDFLLFWVLGHLGNHASNSTLPTKFMLDWAPSDARRFYITQVEHVGGLNDGALRPETAFGPRLPNRHIRSAPNFGEALLVQGQVLSGGFIDCRVQA